MAHRGSDPLQEAVLTPLGFVAPGEEQRPSSLWAPHSPGLALRPFQQLSCSRLPVSAHV